jgi:outer membrane protein assembly factor BamB
MVSLLSALIGQSARGEDWPRWRGPRQDGISKETGLLKTWPKDGPKELWSVALTGGFSSIVTANGRLFTMTKEKNQEVVVCLDPATGKDLWRYRYDCDYAAHPTFTAEGMPQSRTGPRATPTVDGDHVYTIGATGTLLCLEAATGKKVWEQDLLNIGKLDVPMHGFCSCPLVVGDRLYVHPGGSNGKSVAALDKKDGTVLWQALDDKVGQSTPVWAEVDGSPQVIYFTGIAAVGVAAKDGKLLWRYPWKTAYDLNIATPIYADGKVFISSDYGSGAALLRLTGKVEPAIVWKEKSMQNHFSTSILYEGNLYGFSDDRFRCVDFATGKVKWEKAGLGRGSLVVADGRLIVLGGNGQLVLAQATPDSYSEVSRCQVLDKDKLSWIVPIVSNGRLYLRNEYTLKALDLKGSEQ